MRKRLTMMVVMLLLVLGASRGLYAQTGTGSGSSGSAGTAGQTGSTGTTYSDTADRGDRGGHNWGWIGLIGLGGLLGMRRHEAPRDVRTTNPATNR
jgi:MYXO-CTERM domain-containing protein